jgi:phospholipase A1
LKKILFILTLFLILVDPLFAQEKPQTIQPFYPTYWIFGAQDCTYQVSFKYVLCYPFVEGLSFAYTQKSLWYIYDKSSPFKESNYNPQVFYEKEKPIKYFDFYRIGGYYHCSNGRDGVDNRSINKSYLEAQISSDIGQYLNIGIREQYSYYYGLAPQNHDYDHVKGLFESEIFVKIKSRHNYTDHERLYFKGEFTHHCYWWEMGLSGRILTTKFQPHFYIQWYKGYGQFLLTYKQNSNDIRAGLIFEM